MASFLQNVTICILLLSCVGAVETQTDAAVLKKPEHSDVNTVGVRCLWCNSRTLRGCHDPIVQMVAVRVCDESVAGCYTGFDPEGEIERDCFSEDTLTVSHSCASSLCNNVSVDKLSLLGNQLEWRKHLRLMKKFTRSRTDQLTCISCESSEMNSAVASPADPCYSPPKERLNSMSVKCQPSELCETVCARGHVTRGCARAAHDSAVIVCAGDECNNHVDVSMERKFSGRRFGRNSTESMPLHNTLLFHFSLLFLYFC